jgi:PIN domain nuclease of toxin-antitoxin system
VGDPLKLLLDTCTFLWLTSSAGRLSDEVREAIDAATTQLYFSDASVWEVCVKWQHRKLRLPAPPRGWLPEQLGLWHVETVPLEPEHFFRTTELPQLHRDPFDRLLVAQAIERGLTIATPDPAVAAYPVAVLW